MVAISFLMILLGFGLLIFIHELGHFLAAKWAGIRTEAFAIGMGPVILSWRKGVGFAAGPTSEKTRALHGKTAVDMTDEELADCGVGETEYSLRLLPIGGFVKMLGQEDGKPSSVSSHPRSFNMCSIPKRMVVIAAGVIMNALLAVVLFAIAFGYGVRFESPIVGQVIDGQPASSAVAANAPELGVTHPGLMPGDRILAIDGHVIVTFSDIRIAAAMAKPGLPIQLDIARPGIEAALMFSMLPQSSILNPGMLGIGIIPATSTHLRSGTPSHDVLRMLEEVGIAADGVLPGMRLSHINGEVIDVLEQARMTAGDGPVMRSRWVIPDSDEAPVEAILPTRIVLSRYSRPKQVNGRTLVDPALAGLSPLSTIEAVQKGSPNADILHPGDIFIEYAGIPYPQLSQIQRHAMTHPGEATRCTMERDGKNILLDVMTTREGKLEVLIGQDRSRARTGSPVLDEIDPTGGENAIPTPLVRLGITAGSTILMVNGNEIATWDELIEGVLGALPDPGLRTSIRLALAPPGVEEPPIIVDLNLTPVDVNRLQSMARVPSLHAGAFIPSHAILKSEGGVIDAIAMAGKETWKIIYMTYLSIDRVARGTVSVDQLRGPIGIIDIGVKIFPRGAMYFIFFLGLISVSLAVVNFLPIPIFDGGLFLFLLYEAVMRRPPPMRVQNMATVIGLAIIGTLLVVTFYNDIVRLLS